MLRWRVLAGFSTLLVFALALGCEGFFVDPVLTAMTVGPSASLQTGMTVQMSAVGTYNDGSQKSLRSGIFWNSDTPTVATVSSSGLVTGVGPGKAVISGSYQTVTGSANMTVTIGGLTSIKVTSSDGLSSIPYGSAENFVATGTANGQQYDITDSVNWSTNPSSIDNVSISTGGVLITTSGGTQTVTFLVVATDPTTGISGQLSFTVHP